jgi:hypothetical protein
VEVPGAVFDRGDDVQGSGGVQMSRTLNALEGLVFWSAIAVGVGVVLAVEEVRRAWR